MKSTSQMFFLLVAFVALVVGLTYFSQWLPRSPVLPKDPNPGPEKPRAELRKLDFPVEFVDEPIFGECGTEGHYDFYFRNNLNQDVEIGLLDENPKNNVTVTVALLPEELSESLQDKPLPEGLEWHPFKVGGEALLVPKDRAGIVRATWNIPRGERMAQRLDLWCQFAGDQASRKDSNTLGFLVNLTTAFMIFPPLKDPIKFDRDIEADGSGIINFFCLSATRSEFKPNVVIKGRDGNPDPCFTYKSVPMTEDEVKAMIEGFKQLHQQTINFKAGHRLEVTAHETAPDGKTRLDLGAFARTAVFTTDFSSLSEEGRVYGRVSSDIKVLSGDGRIDFKQFDPQEGAEERVPLEAPLNVELTLVGQEPEYLEAKLEKSEEPGRWVLRVKIPPNKARSGPLPRDSSIYLECTGERARRLRILVGGLGSAPKN